jgi:small GTP-binding protein
MKIVVIGNVSTGKTSLCIRWAQGTFTDNYKATVGVDFVVKGDCQLWDVAGQERFGAVTASFYRGSHGALVVLDWTCEKGVDNAQKWIEDYQKKYTSATPILILANKCDLPGRLCAEDLDALCKGNESIIGWIPTSAKTGINVSDAINQLIQCIEATQQERQEREDVLKLKEEDDDELVKECCL